MRTDKDLDAAAKARVASKAQAAAHRELRRRHEDEYRDAYRAAKEQLTSEELART